MPSWSATTLTCMAPTPSQPATTQLALFQRPHGLPPLKCFQHACSLPHHSITCFQHACSLSPQNHMLPTRLQSVTTVSHASNMPAVCHHSVTSFEHACTTTMPKHTVSLSLSHCRRLPHHDNAQAHCDTVTVTLQAPPAPRQCPSRLCHCHCHTAGASRTTAMPKHTVSLSLSHCRRLPHHDNAQAASSLTTWGTRSTCSSRNAPHPSGPCA